MKLSIIIPVFNEEKTISDVIKNVLSVKFPGIEREVIIVDDGSQDKTKEIIQGLKKRKLDFIFLAHDKNMGKGSAVKTGIAAATGDYIVIQDADLEYNPNDIPRLMVPIQKNRATVVYGTRLKRLPNFFHEERTPQFLLHYLGNKGLSLITSLLYGGWITDMETCYKIFPKAAIRDVALHARGFELEPEITAKLLKKGYRIYEIPITTNPRGYEEGKKLNTVRDGLRALWSLVKYRFID